MKNYSSYRVIEIDENDVIWEILDELTDSVLIDQERMVEHLPIVTLLPFDIFEGECHLWH